METSEMTPSWVVKNYLPDYEKRLLKFARSNGITKKSTNFQFLTVGDEFYKNNFAEALCACIYEIWKDACEAQKLECAKNLRTIPLQESAIIDNLILSAPIPEPKNK
jgi:hypothetical protein